MKNLFKDVKIDPSRVLGLTVTVLGVATTLLTNKMEDHKMKGLKEEVKNDILKEIKKSSTND